MGNFGLSVVKTSRSLYHRICSKEFFRLCCKIGKSKKRKITRVELPKNPLLGKMGNFSTVVTQTDTSLYIRICAKNFFQTLQHGKAQ